MGVQIFFFSIFFGFSEIYLFRYEDFVIIFGGQYWTWFRAHFYAFKVFLKVNVQNGDILGYHKPCKSFSKCYR